MLQIRRIFGLIIILLCLVLILPIKEFKPLVTLQGEVKDYIDIHINKEISSSENKLDTPKKQEFAFNNVQMNSSKNQVEKNLGKAKR
ncbi:hypothetical protein SS7213T_09182, partial [Staphylococcus simiae CCM 7213 = CCUG 51256]